MHIAMSLMGVLGIQTQVLTLVHQALYQLGHHPSLFWLVPAPVTSGFSQGLHDAKLGGGERSAAPIHHRSYPSLS